MVNAESLLEECSVKRRIPEMFALDDELASNALWRVFPNVEVDDLVSVIPDERCDGLPVHVLGVGIQQISGTPLGEHVGPTGDDDPADYPHDGIQKIDAEPVAQAERDTFPAITSFATIFRGGETCHI